MHEKTVYIKATSFNIKTLNLFYSFFKNIFSKYNFKIKLIFLKIKKKKITLLKSAHVHKKAREQFQLLKFSFLIIFDLQENKIREILFLLKLNTPKHIDLNFTIKSKIN